MSVRSELTLSDLLSHSNQSSVARALGRPRAYVNAMARGRRNPDIADLPKLAEILRVDLDALTRIVAGDAQRRDADRAGAVA